ncbi:MULTISPECIES: DUF6182 family protein [unclassified Streptomyces]|uniref:DUF6182 family protein n=1 Tax=unclassified Streptomyces TaxID=2593676 RepID=UPI000939DE0A|nr:DUF6182 family protein [Streptomyces sp. CB02414]OKI81357.1 hypothetical protein AMK11_25665 [Streptomyces sp. CB02414]
MTVRFLSPELLLDLAVERVRSARPDLPAGLDLSTPRALQEAKAALAGSASDGLAEVAAVCVVDRFDLPRWVSDTCAFVLSLPEESHGPWRRSFTRTIHLAGRPANLAGRFVFAHVAADGSAAWAAPAPEPATSGLRRLLKTFEGRRPLAAWEPTTLTVPDGPRDRAPGRARRPVRRDLYIATSGVTVADALVQVKHLVAEAVLDRLIGPGDRLTLRSLPRLTGLRVPFAALRVDTDIHRPYELQAFAGLTEEL